MKLATTTEYKGNLWKCMRKHENENKSDMTSIFTIKVTNVIILVCNKMCAGLLMGTSNINT